MSAEEQKPVEVPKVEEATTAEPIAETKAAETTEAPATTTEAATTSETPAETAPAVPAKKEVTPPEEGHLEHKGQGANFPKNIFYTKQFIWFGSDALDTKSLSKYLGSEKSTEVGHHNASWASHTGKGLLFFGDKASPSGAINLSDASEPTADGAGKFHLTSKGHKHTFKAANAVDRDAWVAQLKVKIAEAKELAATVPQTEAYKSALESFKPAKKEKAVETTPAAAETPAETEATKAVEEPVKAAEETPKEEAKEEAKPRSASKKRGSIFGSLLSKKDEKKEEKKEEKAAEATPATETPAEAAATTSTEPAVAPEVVAPVTETAPVAAAAEDKPAETTETPKDAVKDKPTASKRNSIFGVFSKKEKKAQEASSSEAGPVVPAKDDTPAPPTSDVAPVIPPVEAVTPLAAEVHSPATLPVETTETPAATNGAEAKKEVKSERRKSSLPFNFGGKKSPVSDEEGEKSEKKESPFSKLRATIKGRGKPSGEKKEEKAAEKAEETKTEEATTSEAAPATTTAAVEEPEVKPEPVAATTPAVTAAA